MSRVDEAMRRAAQERTGSSAGAPSVAVPVMDDLTAASREAFAVEMPEHRRRRAVPPPAVEPAQAPLTAPVTPGSRLLERMATRVAEKVIVDDRMAPISREQYRRLAAVLHDAQAERGVKVVLIASAVVGEGKTLTAANLALTLSESYRRNVLLIDGDLRRPTLQHLFRIDSVTGLGDTLMAPEDTKLTLHQLSERLSLVPAGRPQVDPMAGLASERMRRLVAEAKETFDWVIIDTPPLVLMPDAPLMATAADGVVLVVRAESTPHALVKRAVDALPREALLGIVLNGASAPARGGEYYGAYYPAQTT